SPAPRFFYSLPTIHYPTLLFFLQRPAAHRDLHSFPTRRSSDLHHLLADRGDGQVGRRHHGRRPARGRQAEAARVLRRRSDRRARSEEHTSELQSRGHLVCRLLLEKKKKKKKDIIKQTINESEDQ